MIVFNRFSSLIRLSHRTSSQLCQIKLNTENRACQEALGQFSEDGALGNYQPVLPDHPLANRLFIFTANLVAELLVFKATSELGKGL